MRTIAELIVRMALENRSWGYTRIQGALANLGHKVGRGTIANTLREHGIDPAPERARHTPWSTFLKAHWECVTATDFFTVEVCTLTGLVTYYVLFFIDLTSRTVKIAGITPHPNEAWMLQIAREGIQVIRLPPRAPNLNAFAERFVRSVKEECLNRMIFFGEASLRHALAEHMVHHCERNHQGLGNRLLQPLSGVGELRAPIKRLQRLGGMLSHYHRQTA
jgi:putative transposase